MAAPCLDIKLRGDGMRGLRGPAVAPPDTTYQVGSHTSSIFDLEMPRIPVYTRMYFWACDRPPQVRRA